MVLNRQDIGDRGGSHIPLIAFGVDDDEFDRVFHRVEDLVDLRRTADSKTEYFVVRYERTLQWLYDAYGVIGGDILFHRGPLPSGEPDGELPAEWRPRQMGRSPLALAMVISDAVWIDTETGRKTILGTFSTIVGHEFPLPFPHLTVYLALTDARGLVPVRIRLVDVDELRDPVGDKKWEGHFSDPVSIVEETITFDNVVFPEPGEYRLQLLSDGELLMERRLMVIPSEV